MEVFRRIKNFLLGRSEYLEKRGLRINKYGHFYVYDLKKYLDDPKVKEQLRKGHEFFEKYKGKPIND